MVETENFAAQNSLFEDLKGCLLIASNSAVVPSVVYAWKHGLVPELAVVTALLVASVGYHYCQSGFWCLVSFGVHQHMDHFFVYCTLAWMALYLVTPSLQWRFTAFIWVQLVVFPLLLEHMHHVWFGPVVGGIIVVAVLTVGLLVGRRPRVSVVNVVVAGMLLLGGIGLFVGGGRVNTTHYWWTHTLWHTLSMLAIYYILDLKHGRSWMAQSLHSEIIEPPPPTKRRLEEGLLLLHQRTTRRMFL